MPSINADTVADESVLEKSTLGRKYQIILSWTRRKLPRLLSSVFWFKSAEAEYVRGNWIGAIRIEKVTELEADESEQAEPTEPEVTELEVTKPEGWCVKHPIWIQNQLHQEGSEGVVKTFESEDRTGAMV